MLIGTDRFRPVLEATRQMCGVPDARWAEVPHPLGSLAELDLTEGDKWVLHRLNETARETGAALAEFRFNEAAMGLYQFTWSEFCDWYLELSKPVLNGEDAAAKAETRATAAWACAVLAVPGGLDPPGPWPGPPPPPGPPSGVYTMIWFEARFGPA